MCYNPLSDGGPAFSFLAHKVHIHRWPPDTPRWSPARKTEIADFNGGGAPKKVSVKGRTLRVAGYEFDSIRKVGITVPMFKRESTVIFEGRCEEFYAHVHITTRSADYIDTFNSLIKWREARFPESCRTG